MARSNVVTVINGWRSPPSPATNRQPTPKSESRLAFNMADWLERISSFSITGKPVRPIVVSGCRAPTRAISCRSSLIALVPWEKLFLSAVSRSMTNPKRPSLVRKYLDPSSLSVATLLGISGQGDRYRPS